MDKSICPICIANPGDDHWSECSVCGGSWNVDIEGDICPCWKDDIRFNLEQLFSNANKNFGGMLNENSN